MINHSNSRQEVRDAIDIVHEALNDLGIVHAFDGDESTPNLWTVAAHDSYGYDNVAFISWDDKGDKLSFIALDPLRANHAITEGLPIEDSPCHYEAPDLAMLVLHLSGTVRQVTNEHRRMVLESAV